MVKSGTSGRERSNSGHSVAESGPEGPLLLGRGLHKKLHHNCAGIGALRLAARPGAASWCLPVCAARCHWQCPGTWGANATLRVVRIEGGPITLASAAGLGVSAPSIMPDIHAGPQPEASLDLCGPMAGRLQVASVARPASRCLLLVSMCTCGRLGSLHSAH